MLCFPREVGVRRVRSRVPPAGGGVATGSRSYIGMRGSQLEVAPTRWQYIIVPVGAGSTCDIRTLDRDQRSLLQGGGGIATESRSYIGRGGSRPEVAPTLGLGISRLRVAPTGGGGFNYVLPGECQMSFEGQKWNTWQSSWAGLRALQTALP